MIRKKNGFTLVELLAVIVILAIILVIAVPQIMKTIENAREGTLKSTAQLIAKSAEKEYLVRQTLGDTDFTSIDSIPCTDVVELDENTYGLCKIKFDSNGKATVILNGKENGKFHNKACSGTANNITCQEGEILPGLNCTYDGELVQGVEFQQGQYTYRYMQEYMGDWTDTGVEGWGVILTDKESTDPVNEPVCSYINGKPLVSTAFMFVEMDMESGNPVPSQASSIDVSSWDTDNVTNMFGMFAYAPVTEIKGLSSLEMNKVENMAGMFAYSSFEEIDLSNKDLSSAQNMMMMFAESQAKEVNMSNVDARNVTNIANMFTYLDFESGELVAPCTIETINMSGANFSSVTDMSYMFFGSSIKTLNLSNMDARSVTSVAYMFAERELGKELIYNNIETLNMNGINFSGLKDASGLFAFSNAKTFDYTNIDFSNVETMNSMFSLSSLESIDITSWDTSSVIDMGFMFWLCSETTSINLTGIDTSKVENMGGMFADLNGLEKEIIGLNTLNTSSVVDMGSMFSGLKTSEIDLSSWDTSKVENMGGMFEESRINKINLSGLNANNVINMSSMFNLSSATDINLTGMTALNVEYMESMFTFSPATTIDLSGFDTSNVTNMEYIFSNSAATTGYARTQADADKFNNASVTSIPSTLTFIVK